jgi:ribosomal protein L11 methyltransferase
VLDVGCGSGILAIAAAKLGASYVHAIDIDPIAVQTTEQNAAANGVTVSVALADESLSESFDVVVANILSQPLKVLAPMLSARTRPGGRLLLSGILERQAETICQAYRPFVQHLGDLVVLDQRDGWVCIGNPASP